MQYLYLLIQIPLWRELWLQRSYISQLYILKLVADHLIRKCQKKSIELWQTTAQIYCWLLIKLHMIILLIKELIRLSYAVLSGANNKSAQWSATILLISSGIFLLNDLQPASKCITGICNFAAAKAPARGVFGSANTSTASGFSFIKISSILIIIFPV